MAKNLLANLVDYLWNMGCRISPGYPCTELNNVYLTEAYLPDGYLVLIWRHQRPLPWQFWKHQRVLSLWKIKEKWANCLDAKGKFTANILVPFWLLKIWLSGKATSQYYSHVLKWLSFFFFWIKVSHGRQTTLEEEKRKQCKIYHSSTLANFVKDRLKEKKLICMNLKKEYIILSELNCKIWKWKGKGKGRGEIIIQPSQRDV